MLKKQTIGWSIIMPLALVLFVLIIPVCSVHAQQPVSPLSVTQSGIAKINELIANKRLDANWPEKFSDVSVSTRNIKGFAEYVLQFKSNSGPPETLTLYFDFEGQYSGSSLDN